MGRKYNNVATATTTTAFTPIVTSIKYKDTTGANTKSGNYEYNPANKNLYGWICPVCGRGVSPYHDECSCRSLPINGYITTSPATIDTSNIALLSVDVNCAKNTDQRIKDKLSNFIASKT